MRHRRAGLLVLIALLACAAGARAEHLAPGSLRLTPDRPGRGTTLAVNAGFDQKTGAQLQAYNVDIARGFRFDPKAVAGRCMPAQAHASSCPASSRMGGGEGQVRIEGPGAPSGPQRFTVDFYVAPPQQRGDVTGLVLSVHQPGSALGFALVGRLVTLAHGPFGLELRFANTASELPSGYTVQLNHIQARIGAHRRLHGRTHSLLTNPPTCRSHGWPFRLVVAYSTGTETYNGTGACSAR